MWSHSTRRRIRRASRTAAWILGSFLLSSMASAESLGSRDAAQLTVLHLADVYEIAPVDGGNAGGLARVATLERSLVAEGREVLVTLGGDFLSPSVASALFQGKQMVETLGLMGLDLATLGNHEFDFGLELLRTRMGEASFDWLVANVLDATTQQPIGGASPWVVREFGGLRVGFLGLCLTGDEISPKRREGVVFLDALETAERYLPFMEQAGAEVIVALTHLNFSDDVRLAERFPQIDLILGGHDHFPITTQIGSTLISKPGSDARNVVRIDISRPRGGGPVEKHFEMIPITPEIEDDEVTANLVDAWESRLDRELEVVVGTTTEPLDAVAESVRSGESNLGNLMTDGMRVATGSEIAIVNGGIIRSNRVYPVGEITRRSLLAIHPFGGIVCEVEITGEVVLEMLNHGVARLGESLGRFPQVSGIQFAIDPDKPAGSRVVDITVGEEPLDPERLYRVAVSDYMLDGGDGYSMLPGSRVLVSPESGELIVAALARHFRDQGVISPQVEGRIRFATGIPEQVARKGVILDTDMGIDSVIGLLYLLKAPEVDVRAVTLVHGVADLEPGGSNVLRILDLMGMKHVPVALGSRGPLVGSRDFPSFWTDEANTLGGAELPMAESTPREDAADLIISLLESTAEPLNIVAMGPLTNVAEVLSQRPDLVGNIAEVVVMGGALDVPGNVGNPFVGIRNFSAEWNFYVDPHAADKVLRSGVRVRLMPLDATLSLPVTPEFVDRIRNQPGDQTSSLLLALLESVDRGIAEGWYYFWDVLAAVGTAWPEIYACRDERIDVVLEEGPDLGQTRLSETGSLVCVGEEINRRSFEDHLVEAILD